MNKNMIKAIADFAIFLEFSNDKILDSDASIEVFEQLASELQLMDKKDKEEFAKEMILLGDIYSGHESQFVKTLPESLGIL